RRQVAGVDYHRVSIILAVLERRVGINLQTQDVYVNAAGGVRISEPACDLAIAVAVASSYYGRAIDPLTLVVGEVGLAGEVRSVGHMGERLAEATRLGFRKALVPSRYRQSSAPAGKPSGAIELLGASTVQEAIAAVLGESPAAKKPGTAQVPY